MIMRQKALAIMILCCTASPQIALAKDKEAAPAAKGEALLQPFKQQLQQALKSGLANGPDAAIAACNEQAPQIAASLSADGVRLGRTSHRLRNPANAGPAWVRPILDAYAAAPDEAVPRTVELDENLTGYVEPIMVQPMCLLCHGEQVAPGISARLQSLYPDDEATGYAAGDLRGVFWVEFTPR